MRRAILFKKTLEGIVMTATADMKPKHEIRRFDVFAEYRKQDKQAKDMPEDEAMGYGLWVAKVVASRHRSGSKDDAHHSNGGSKASRKKQLVEGKWYTLGDEPQTDALFQDEIIDRMGRTFYRRVFMPAISRARKDGKSYEDIRDSLRKSWKAS